MVVLAGNRNQVYPWCCQGNNISIFPPASLSPLCTQLLGEQDVLGCPSMGDISGPDTAGTQLSTWSMSGSISQ